MTDLYAVMGHPIAHSKSPRIHAQFAASTGERLSYRAIDVPPGTFDAAVADFQARGGSGLNVTLPFKEQAFDLADEVTARAERAGAVNTLWFKASGTRYGDNTDGVGLVRDLRANHGIPIHGRRVLLIGAGGAARGVLGPLLDEEPAALTVANRTVERAERLVDEFKTSGSVRGAGAELDWCALDGLAGRCFDLVINATSTGIGGVMPPLPETLLQTPGWCYDLMYADRPTPFVQWGSSHGAALSVDGLGMLVEQAAESFFCWRGVRPDTGPVIADLRGAG